MKRRRSSVLLVGSKEVFKESGVTQVFNGSGLQLLAISSSLLEALASIGPGTMDVVLLSHEFCMEEVALFTSDARRRGYMGLILRTVDNLKITPLAATEGNDPIKAGDIVISESSHRAWIRGAEIRCTALEFELLSHLCKHPDKLLRHEALLEALWGDSTAPRHLLRELVRSVRSKIETTKPHRYIVTQRRIGYRFVPSPSPVL